MRFAFTENDPATTATGHDGRNVRILSYYFFVALRLKWTRIANRRLRERDFIKFTLNEWLQEIDRPILGN